MPSRPLRSVKALRVKASQAVSSGARGKTCPGPTSQVQSDNKARVSLSQMPVTGTSPETSPVHFLLAKPEQRV